MRRYTAFSQRLLIAEARSRLDLFRPLGSGQLRLTPKKNAVALSEFGRVRIQTLCGFQESLRQVHARFRAMGAVSIHQSKRHGLRWTVVEEPNVAAELLLRSHRHGRK